MPPNYDGINMYQPVTNDVLFFPILTGNGYFEADGLATAPGVQTGGSSTSFPKISESIEAEYMYPKFPWCGSSCLLLNWCCCNFVGPSGISRSRPRFCGDPCEKML